LAEQGSLVFIREIESFLNFQRNDFKEMFNLLKGQEISIRLIDPPLHEFFNCTDQELKELSKISGLSFEKIKEKVDSLHEQNPMLGHRGVRLGVTYSELYKAQIEAIFRACNELGFTQKVNIMIPLVSFKQEFEIMKSFVKDVHNKVGKLTNIELKIGVMIETPRACLIAKELKEYVDFFSFGTNDLTQTTLGISRDDCANFMPDYIKLNIVKQDPFVEIDESVIDMMKLAISDLDIKSGVCGEHGGEFNSIQKFSKININYVSCSPYRVPVARFAVAFAELNKEKQS
jgi:pyruvate,orthophosphate dikinase